MIHALNTNEADWPASTRQSWPQTASTGAAIAGASRILAVSAGEDTYQYLRRLLDQTGAGTFRLHRAAALDKPLEAIPGDVPDAYLIDVPGGTAPGCTTHAVIARTQRHAPVIVIAQRSNPDLEARVMSAGAAGFLVKAELGPKLLVRSVHHAIERWRLEQALGACQRRFEDIAEVATDWLWEMDEDLRMTFVSPRIGEITGFVPACAIGKTRWEFLDIDLEHDSHWARHKADLDARRPFRNFCYSSTNPDGRTFHFKLNGKPVFDPPGVFRGYRGTGTDMTAEVESGHRVQDAESQLLRAQKLESIGQIAAGIAHEINTPTQYVGDNIRFLLDAFGDLLAANKALRTLLAAARDGTLTADRVVAAEHVLDDTDIEYLGEEVPEAIEQSLEGVRRITRIVGAMKEFSHPGSKDKECADLNRIVDSTLTVASNEWKYVANLKLDLDPSLPLVPCYPPALGQVVLNLVVNAAHAIADVVGADSTERGRLGVSTRQVDGRAEIRISDTGTGIPETVRTRIFDPFFTTKEVGKGTGQGLAISHSTIVDQHGGNLYFETETGTGTTFIIRLPLEVAGVAGEGLAP